MTSRSRLVAAVLAFALLGIGTGCGDDKCADHSSEAPKPIDGGRTDPDALIYQSAAWDEELTAFPPNTPLAFLHGLGHTPELVQTYVSFSHDGTQGSNVSENAGSQGLIKCVDADVIVVMNDTCEANFYIRVVASASPSAPADDVKCLSESASP
jgi:hypothetical protein